MQQNMKAPTPEALASMFKASGLKEKFLFTFLIIVIFRLGVHLPLFGIDNTAFSLFAKGNNLVNFIDLFSGGALGKISILALGIGPYITSSIIMQLLTVIIPHLEHLQKEEGEAGRRKISQYTRFFTLFIAIFQSSMFLAFLLKTSPGLLLPGINTGFFFLGSVTILTAGSLFIMWLAELITERGIGNGGSLLIFVGILSRIPVYVNQSKEMLAADSGQIFGLVGLLIIFFATMVFIVVMQEAVRKVIIVNPKRQVGNKIYGGNSTFIPFKLNPGGVMPIIFAMAILYFPATVLGLLGKVIPAGSAFSSIVKSCSDFLNPSGVPHYVIYFLLIVLLTFFYASIMPNMQPKEIANNLKKYGSSIPGIKPGKPTADALDKILTKTTFIGAFALGIIALIPSIAALVTNNHALQGIGATSLIIMVGVALDLINQVKTHLLARNYESFLKND